MFSDDIAMEQYHNMAVRKFCLQLWVLIVSVFFVNFKTVDTTDDFYGILGVSRSANNDEIRRAYRRLARDWHPDKNKDADAQEKFIKINEAYETLSDPRKREDYDRYGESGAPPNWQQDSDFFQESEFMFFNGMPFQFQSNWRHHDFITLNFFRKSILPESHKKPYLLEIVSEWCMNCAAVEEIWEYTSGELRSFGVGVGRVNRNMDPKLARELGTRRLPDFVGVIGGKWYHFSGTVTVENLKEFVCELFPDSLVPEVTNSTLGQFLTKWYDNMPRALLFTTKTKPPLLLKIVSYKYRSHVGVGYLQLTKPQNSEPRDRFGAAKDEPSFAIFKESASLPEVLLRGSELKSGTLDEVLSENLYLHFPRISSPAMFEALCPQSRYPSQRSMCVILFTNNNPKGHPLLDMSKDRTWLKKRIRFGYINQATQEQFASSIKMTEKTRSVCKDNILSEKVAILWHVRWRRANYTWLEDGWCRAGDAARLSALLNSIHSGKVHLELTAVVPQLYDEHAKGFVLWVLDLWNDLVYYAFHYVNWSGTLPVLSVVVTIAFVFMVSCLFPSMAEKDGDMRRNGGPRHADSGNVFGLVQLNSQTQHQLVHKARQGHLVVVLLSDATSQAEAAHSPIVQTFAEIARCHLREQIFTFAWLSIPNHIAWCNEVMKVQTFGEVKPGTVLAINGAKKYLSIFKVQIQNKRDGDDDSRNLFDDSEDDDIDRSSMVFREDRRTQRSIAEALAQQFPRWIEKLLQGMLPRVKLDSWPRMECDK